MSSLTILLPVFAQVILTFALLFWMFSHRVGALKSKTTKMADIALGQQNWPVRATQVANSFNNQLELPTLFYALVALVLTTGQVSLPLVVLAWVFVTFRFAHVVVHTGSNYVPRRFYAFAGSVFALLAMWIVFAAQIIMASST